MRILVHVDYNGNQKDKVGTFFTGCAKTLTGLLHAVLLCATNKHFLKGQHSDTF